MAGALAWRVAPLVSPIARWATVLPRARAATGGARGADRRLSSDHRPFGWRPSARANRGPESLRGHREMRSHSATIRDGYRHTLSIAGSQHVMRRRRQEKRIWVEIRRTAGNWFVSRVTQPRCRREPQRLVRLVAQVSQRRHDLPLQRPGEPLRRTEYRRAGRWGGHSLAGGVPGRSQGRAHRWSPPSILPACEPKPRRSTRCAEFTLADELHRRLFLPFQFTRDRTQLRMMSNYFAKLPRELVVSLFGDDGLGWTRPFRPCHRCRGKALEGTADRGPKLGDCAGVHSWSRSSRRRTVRLLRGHRGRQPPEGPGPPAAGQRLLDVATEARGW